MQSNVGWLYTPVSKGVLGSPYQPECRSEPFVFRKPGLASEGTCVVSPALRCGLGSRAGLPRPAGDTFLLLMQLKIPFVCLAAAPTVDSY